MISAGSDGKIMVWEFGNYNSLSFRHTIEIDLSLKPLSTKISAVCTSNVDEEKRICIATRGSDIIEYRNRVPFKIMSGHEAGKLTGICLDSEKENHKYFYTCGEDGAVGKFDFKDNKQVESVKTQYSFSCFDLQPDGKILACGTYSGNIFIFELPQL